MTFFSHRPGFSDLDSLFRFSVSLLYQMSYMTLSSQQKPSFNKRIPWRHLFFYSLQTFAPIPQHYFSKYWGRPMHGPSPYLKFWGTVPPVPLGLRPCPSLRNHLPLRFRSFILSAP